MVDRGNCTFVSKIKNIELIGGKLGIVVDNKKELTENLIMADDGAGSSVHIPSFIIRNSSGSILKDTLNMTDTHVYLKIELSIKHPDDRVEYELWYSSIFDL